jgi:NhaP-type Na+/H+ or K+/H+ antiporter
VDALALIVLLAVLGQLLALVLRVPAILVLLLLGMAAGGWLGWLDPDAMFGTGLFDAVDLAVAVILFEGGLLLDFRELRGDVSSVVRRLLLRGVVLTAVGGAAAGYFILGMSLPVAAVFGSILTVSGPTVVLPLLRHVKVEGRVGSILKWEGVFIDAIGATMAVIVYETVVAGQGNWGPATLGDAGLTLAIGAVVGLGGAALLVLVMRWDAVDDSPAALLSLAMVMAAFVASEMLRHEAGLMAAIVMGVALANQRFVSVTRVIRFKETLGVLLTSVLFIVLAARLDLADLRTVLAPVAVVVAVLVLVVRPVVVWLCSLGSSLTLRERGFVGWLAPRGIVAAATASVMGTGLEDVGLEGASDLVPAVFLVILGTVTIYGLTGRPMARLLGVAEPERPLATEVADQAGGVTPGTGAATAGPDPGESGDREEADARDPS